MTLRDHLGPRTEVTAALHDELDRLEAAPAAVLMEAGHRVNETIAERQADLHGARNSFNKGAVDALQEVQARIRALATPDSTAALKRVIEKALGMANRVRPLVWVPDRYEENWWIAKNRMMNLVFEVRVTSRGATRTMIAPNGWEDYDGDAQAAMAEIQAFYETCILAPLNRITADDVLREMGGRG